MVDEVDNTLISILEQVPALAVLSYITYVFIHTVIRLNESNIAQANARDLVLREISIEFAKRSDAHNIAYSALLKEALAVQKDVAISVNQNTHVIEELSRLLREVDNGKHT